MRSDSLGASTMQEGETRGLEGGELEKKRRTTGLVHARNISCSVQRTHALPHCAPRKQTPLAATGHCEETSPAVASPIVVSHSSEIRILNPDTNGNITAIL